MVGIDRIVDFQPGDELHHRTLLTLHAYIILNTSAISVYPTYFCLFFSLSRKQTDKSPLKQTWLLLALTLNYYTVETNTSYEIQHVHKLVCQAVDQTDVGEIFFDLRYQLGVQYV